MTAVSRLIAKYDSLARAGRRAADFILSDPGAASAMSMGDIADKAGVSAATVTRLAAALGYGSFLEFRAALSKGKDAGLRVPDEGATDPRLMKVFTEYLNRLNNTLAITDPAKLADLARALRSCDYCVLAGLDADTPLAIYLARRLNLMGVTSVSATDAPVIAALASHMTKNSVYIGMCRTERRGPIYDGLRFAKRRGCVTAFMSADASSPAATTAGCFLRAFESPDEPANGIGRLALCEALLNFVEDTK